jgi:hypothetical protein
MAPRERSETWRASVRSSEFRAVSKNRKAMFVFALKLKDIGDDGPNHRSTIKWKGSWWTWSDTEA